ncbi:MAG: hypothetical protein ACE14T_02210 [Syntrophales bacterium]
MSPNKKLLLFLLLFLAGCRISQPEVGPREAVIGYLDAYVNGRFEEARRYISCGAEKKIREAKGSERSFEEKIIRQAIIKKVNYEIQKITVRANRAEALVAITVPDFETILLDVAMAVSAGRFPEGGLDSLNHASDLLGAIVNRYRENGIPEKTTRENFELVKESEGWKILSIRSS